MALMGAALIAPRGQAEILFQHERADAVDVIYFHNNDVLRGEVLNESLSISTPYGFAEIPLRVCAGVSFERSNANTEELVTIHASRLTGIITERRIRFRIESSGAEITIRKEKIKFILLKKNGGTPAIAGPEGETTLFVMANGDLLNVRTEKSVLSMSTEYGDIPLSFDQLDGLELRGNGAAVATMKNGDVMRGTLGPEEFSLELDGGVSLDSVHRDRLAKVLVGKAGARATALLGTSEPVKENAPALRPFETAVAATETITNSIGMKLKQILPGTFKMGSSDGLHSEKPVHEVVITQPFFIGVYEVTQAQWESVMGSNPSFFAEPERPVERVSWDKAQVFLERLSEMENAAYRLPTEAEWEYACRAGSETTYYWGDTWDAAHAWSDKEVSKQSHVVGLKKPNAWGLHDMSGNVWEWCQDWYSDYPPAFKATDPQGPSMGKYRVLRGGSWLSNHANCRSTRRNSNPQGSRSTAYGFRVVRSP